MLDIDRVSEAINALGGNYTKFINITLESINQCVESIEQSIADEDYDALARGAHKLKGLAGTVGAPEVMELCKKIENEATTNNLEMVMDQYKYLLIAVEKLEFELKKVSLSSMHHA